MAAQVIPMVRAAEAACNDHQRGSFMAFLDARLNVMEQGCPMNDLGEIT